MGARGAMPDMQLTTVPTWLVPVQIPRGSPCGLGQARPDRVLHGKGNIGRLVGLPTSRRHRYRASVVARLDWAPQLPTSARTCREPYCSSIDYGVVGGLGDAPRRFLLAVRVLWCEFYVTGLKGADEAVQLPDRGSPLRRVGDLTLRIPSHCTVYTAPVHIPHLEDEQLLNHEGG